METKRLETLKQLADGVAAQFGNNCEVVIHDVSSRSSDHSIAYIVNGHVSGRKIGDGGSQIVLDQLASQDKQPQQTICATSHARRTGRFSSPRPSTYAAAAAPSSRFSPSTTTCRV